MGFTKDSPFFDFQVNGFGGIDFQSETITPADLNCAIQGLLDHRTGGIFLTLITDTIPALEAKLHRFEAMRAEDPLVASVVLGYHLEGPYLSPLPGFRGAHRAAFMKNPDEREFARLQSAANGRIRLVTLAPERPGSREFIASVAGAGVTVSLGHSDASTAEIRDAVRAGASLVTHLGNAVPLQLHRHDNIMQRLLDEEALTISLIPDGIHLPPFVLRNYLRVKGLGKTLFTTDCMAAAGMGPGSYRLLDLRLDVGPDGIVHMPGQSRFAGSSLSMDRAVENLERWLGLSATDAAAQCSQVPRAFFGID